MVTSRTYMTNMSTTGRLDGGIYKCDLTYENYINLRTLVTDLTDRMERFAKIKNGVLESRTITYPDSTTIRVVDVYAFLNLESMLSFAQQCGYPQGTRAVRFFPDYSSLAGLI